ncbi:hypothetical protein F53441_13182 [Fusarium austroafricanum]|uniref:Uncharacterized protein n=1 Tax=Fusarium austroafricanum TaxID=2364996 RepID=A0A8H4JSK1_9HYPO|nr:hypothetical protein F53441_13182 [Fusarium austroafricanum]
MSITTRRTLRLRTVDNDEVSDTKIGIALMRPKREVQPPKSLASLYVELPSSKSRRRPNNASHNMSDKEIASKLKWHMRRSTMGKRVGDAARTIFKLSRQWPWELAAGFLPKRWGVEILENLRKLCRTAERNADCKKDFQQVKDYLRDCVMKRDRKHPCLKSSDVLQAWAHFAVDDYVKSEATHASITSANIKPYSGGVEDEDESCKEEEESDASGVDSEDEWEDWTGYDHFGDDDAEMADQKDAVAASAKRPRSASAISQSPKRARTDEKHPPRPQTFTDLIGSLQLLVAEKQKELDATTTSLRDITASIQAGEATQAKPSEVIDKLCSDVKIYETEREKILKGRKFVEEHHEDMAIPADDLATTLGQYTARLEEYDKLIAQANADVLEELGQIAQRDFDLKNEEERLEGREKEVLKEVRQYQAIETLMRLDPSGMTKLLGRLEDQGVSLVGMAEGIIKEAEE